VVQIKDISYTIENRLILDHLNLVVNDGEKIGLVGVNGAGKSTLLRAITGNLELDSGHVQNNGTITYLEQEIKKNIEDNKFDVLSIEEYLVLEKGLDMQPWEISKYLHYMNMDDKVPQNVFGELSGGQKIKIELLAILSQKPDLLVLDEPTNFLDIPTAEWLMRFLSTYPNSVLVVSHDLRLMNRSIDRIWYLNEMTHKVESFNGNYEQFLTFKEKQNEWLVKALKNQEKKVKKMFETASVLAGRKSAKEKIKAAKLLARAKSANAEVKTKMTETGRKSKHMKIAFETGSSSGRNVLNVTGISKSFGSKAVLKNISFSLARSERMIIVGRNGIGKTTLLKILTGKTEQTEGIYKYGHNVDIGYYAQEYDGLDYNKSLIDNFLSDPKAKELGKKRIMQILGGFLFDDDRLDQKVATLSGGEKTRLSLAKLITHNCNTLLLDEPTTYLDPTSQKILLNALKDYTGTVVLVSHVPEFVKEFQPDKVLLLPEEKFTYYEDKYIHRVREE